MGVAQGFGSTVASVRCTKVTLDAFVNSVTTPAEATDAVAHADLDELWPTLSRHKATLRKGTDGHTDGHTDDHISR